MIRITNLKLKYPHDSDELGIKIRKKLNIEGYQLKYYQIVRRSLDARHKPDIYYIYTVDVSVYGEYDILKKNKDKNIFKVTEQEYQVPQIVTSCADKHPIVVGDGPAGLFCAYVLAKAGMRPHVIERGSAVEKRQFDVISFWREGKLDRSSNVQFGEGGAGTFSDGKLNTLIKDPLKRGHFVLRTFVDHGASPSILYEARPHIGTDGLAQIIKNIRHEMERLGAVFSFDTTVTDYMSRDGAICQIELNGNEWIDADTVVLATGHSARDTFRMLYEKNELDISARSFAVGFRVEHPQEMINISQYGVGYDMYLPPAFYKLSCNDTPGRGVYSFCMCPGGYVVNASSEEGRLAVNGMSYANRGSHNANSAIIVQVTPDDFVGDDALSGVRFQEELEEKAFRLSHGLIPQQLFKDYCDDVISTSYGRFESMTKGDASFANLRGLLPADAELAFINGMHRFGHMIKGFDRDDCILSAIESRTSSPVRIKRDEHFMSGIKGLYPCGEGAGYAGGIMSAAIDGMKVAEAIIKRS